VRAQLPVGMLVTATVGLLVALGLRPISIREIVAAYVLALTAIALLMLTRIARTDDEWARETSQLELALTPRKTVRTRPTALVRTDRDLVLSEANAGELHTRLLPQLRDVAAARLVDRHDLQLRDARGVLGDEVWELLRPDRPAPADRGAPGLPMRRIAALIDTIERL
jgi:hypothetical protein